MQCILLLILILDIKGNDTVLDAHPRSTPDIHEYPRYLYTAELNNLSPGTTYYLSVGDQANLNSFSEEIKFRTIPMDAEFSFVAGGDNGASRIVKDVSDIRTQA